MDERLLGGVLELSLPKSIFSIGAADARRPGSGSAISLRRAILLSFNDANTRLNIPTRSTRVGSSFSKVFRVKCPENGHEQRPDICLGSRLSLPYYLGGHIHGCASDSGLNVSSTAT